MESLQKSRSKTPKRKSVKVQEPGPIQMHTLFVKGTDLSILL